jgi:hypothetical protein
MILSAYHHVLIDAERHQRVELSGGEVVAELY